MARERGCRLQRQAVDQVEIDGTKSQCTGCFINAGHQGFGLHAVYRSLNLFVKILHAQADAVESHGRQKLQAACIDATRIDFDGVVAICGVRQLEFAIEPGDDVDEIGGRQKRRCAATEMQLIDNPVSIEEAAA